MSNKRSKIIFTIVVIAIIALLAWVGYSMLADRATEVSWSQFVSYVENSKPSEEGEQPSTDKDGEVVLFEKVVIGPYAVYGYTEMEDRNYSYYATAPDGYDIDSTTVKEWSSWGIDIGYEDPNAGSIWSSVISMFGIVLVCVIFWVIISQTAGGGNKALSFGKTKAKVSTNIKVRFSDVAGAEEEKEELQEITEFLKNPHKFSDLGARIPKGVLLVGPPGTGKTLFAKAVAGEAGVPFFSVSGSDFVEMYVGVGASRVRDLFEIAKRNQPCIIFIDEIDAVGRERGAGLGGGSDEREQTLNQILVQMDGFESNEAIIVMAATNRSDVLDPALMRPGRFDRKIMVNLPDVKGREAILKVHARNKPLAPDVNFKTIARITSGFSGADLENLLNEAAILAARANKKLIGNTDLYEAVNKVEMGPAKKSRVVTEADKRVTAYHEAGHAIINQLSSRCGTVHEVTIIPRGNAGGFTAYRPDTDDQFYTKNQLKDRICMALGGRAAEEIVLKDVTQGACGDIQSASAIAREMVTVLGMSEKLGLIAYGDSRPVFIGKQLGRSQEYSEQTAALIDEEVRSIVEEQHARAVQLLTEHRSALDNMARVLVERKTIYTEEVDMLVKGATVEEVLKAMDEQDKSSGGNPFARFESSSASAEKQDSNTTAKSGTESEVESEEVKSKPSAASVDEGTPSNVEDAENSETNETNENGESNEDGKTE